MGVAILAGFLLGFFMGNRAMPGALPWLFGGMFSLFFGVLAFVFTGMTSRRDRGIVTETIEAIPASMVVSLKEAIEQANPPSHLASHQVAQLDTVLAELEDLARLLRKQPRAGADPALPAKLEEIAAQWLSADQQDEWISNNS
ncbi:MAG: hypothetical protein JWP00_689 [Chloroflexi bacterium]|jgi:hypothetical protein|nr:hypothetical protein [Chloroflexota bacterium]